MAELVAIAILVVLAVPFFLALSRASNLFEIEVRNGRARHVSGRLPQRLFNDIDEIVRRPAIEQCRIRCIGEGGSPRVVVRGKISDEQLQRLRNVVGKYQVGQIRAGKRPRA